MQTETRLSLTELINATDLEMHKSGYSEATIATYEKIWRMLVTYAHKKNITQYSTKFAFSFLQEKFGGLNEFPHTFTQAEYFRGVNRLDEYFKYGFISSKRPLRKTYFFPPEFNEPIQSYLVKRKSEGVSDSRIQCSTLYLERFAEFLHEIGVKGFRKLSVKHINRYIEERLIQFTASTVSATICCLRVFLIYLHTIGEGDINPDACLPRLRHTSEETIPSAFSREEVNLVLKCVDRCNPTGKRNYAMLVLAARLGLRASDICGMELSNLKWEENKIEFIQRKTRKPTSLPLLNEVGDAIIDYLQVRPYSNSQYVFLRADPPHMRINSGSLYEITQNYMRRSGIHIPPGKKHGPHSLRHSLSSMMLESSVLLPVISGILSHSSTETTKVYLKIDLRQLKECALDVPTVHTEGV